MNFDTEEIINIKRRLNSFEHEVNKIKQRNAPKECALCEFKWDCIVHDPSSLEFDCKEEFRKYYKGT